LERGDDLADVLAGDRHLFLVGGELAERGRDANQCHRSPPRAARYAARDVSFLYSSSNALSEAAITGGPPIAASSGSVVLRPLPVIATTTHASLRIRPSSISFCAAASVTPPAVSVKMPSLSARSRIAATISSSVALAA